MNYELRTMRRERELWRGIKRRPDNEQSKTEEDTQDSFKINQETLRK